MRLPPTFPLHARRCRFAADTAPRLARLRFDDRPLRGTAVSVSPNGKPSPDDDSECPIYLRLSSPA